MAAKTAREPRRAVQVGGRGAAAGNVRAKDLQAMTFVVAVGPPGVPPGTPVLLDSRGGLLVTGQPRSIRAGAHRFELSANGVAFRRLALCPPGCPPAQPFEVAVNLPVPSGIQPAAAAAPAPRQPRASLSVRAGAAPLAETVVYIHGLGNKPTPSVLKCQWDTALFGTRLGDRSRMAYWVNRSLYPVPTDATCGSRDTVDIEDDEATTAVIMALAGNLSHEEREARQQAAIDREIDALAHSKEQGDVLRALAARMRSSPLPSAAGSLAAADYAAKLLPLPEPLRRLIAAQLTRAFLRDANEFLFNAERRAAMTRSLAERLSSGGGPFVVIAHSQGSMIAYETLRHFSPEECPVKLLVTIGSPLGLQEVQDRFREWDPEAGLTVPRCVERWVNVADRLDPVAFDSELKDDFGSGDDRLVDCAVSNPDSPRHPHSATGYLKTAPVQDAVRHAVGNGFAQPVARAIIVRDLAQDFEDALTDEPVKTLIQLSTDSLSDRVEGLDEVRRTVVAAIERMAEQPATGGRPRKPTIDHMRRYIAAELTRNEAEQLRTQFHELKIERIWRNAAKRALINVSTATVQARTANLGYRASGRRIGWAVLDTGIAALHPHFRAHKNVKLQWDCTRNGTPQPVDAVHSAKLDQNGHGTHVAATIAGELTVEVDSDTGEAELFAGMAPQTELYGFKVLDDQGNGHDSYIIKALDAVAELNERSNRLVIHGVNLSLGGNFDPTVFGCGHTPLCEELRRLWRQGVLVCLAAGNEGYAVLQSADGEFPANLDVSIGDPANLDEAIAVGSVHKRNPHTYGVSYFSSRGPTADGRRKPDLVAPGEQILSAWHDYDRGRYPNPRQSQRQRRIPPEAPPLQDLYVEMSGTSMATPHVSGILAAFLSARPEFIGYPDRVKRILLESCTDLERDRYHQGAGLPNLVKMLANT